LARRRGAAARSAAERMAPIVVVIDDPRHGAIGSSAGLSRSRSAAAICARSSSGCASRRRERPADAPPVRRRDRGAHVRRTASAHAVGGPTRTATARAGPAHHAHSVGENPGGVQRWMRTTRDQQRNAGRVSDLVGRRRWPQRPRGSSRR
jgi:hypothetical protein